MGDSHSRDLDAVGLGSCGFVPCDGDDQKQPEEGGEGQGGGQQEEGLKRGQRIVGCQTNVNQKVQGAFTVVSRSALRSSGNRDYECISVTTSSAPVPCFRGFSLRLVSGESDVVRLLSRSTVAVDPSVVFPKCTIEAAQEALEAC